MEVRKTAQGMIVVIILLVAFVSVLRVAAKEQTQAAYTSFQNITVDVAYHMIKHDSPAPVILDVRNQSEYDMGHLYGAVLIPVYQLEARIGELAGNEDHKIIVYCYGGHRSPIACGILVEHNFTKVYNMLGGILAWIQAGYPIYTTYHLVTVNGVDYGILSQIEPLLLYNSGCGCSAKNTKVTVSGPNVTVLEKTENYTVTLTTLEINGTLLEITSASTLLWSDTESTYESNKTIKLKSNQITVEGTSSQFYILSYVVQNEEYNLTIYTVLEPLDSETYNSSFTYMSYVPRGETSVQSLEFVEFNCSVILSQQYYALGEVAKEMMQVYGESGDSNLTVLAGSYLDMGKEASYLSEFVRERLTQYDHLIIRSSAALQDTMCGPPECGSGGGGGGGGGNAALCLVCDLGLSVICGFSCAMIMYLFPPFDEFIGYCLEYGCAVMVAVVCSAYCS
jgi:rhodanese-related sulfurtransferase